MTDKKTAPLILLLLALVALCLSAIRPHDYPTWALEVFPVFIGLALLLPTFRSFPLTTLLYGLMFLHALVLVVGGHYTYAQVPMGFWIENALGLTRNPYDRIGHFMQGFMPAMLAREILIRKNVVTSKKWIFFLVTSICLAFSACYEFLEWAAALINSEAAESFLGTQGDVWDTQWDMFTCLIGALVAQLSLRTIHERQLRDLPNRN